MPPLGDVTVEEGGETIARHGPHFCRHPQVAELGWLQAVPSLLVWYPAKASPGQQLSWASSLQFDKYLWANQLYTSHSKFQLHFLCHLQRSLQLLVYNNLSLPPLVSSHPSITLSPAAIIAKTELDRYLPDRPVPTSRQLLTRMAATSYAYRGLEAVEKKDWAAAVPLLDKALEGSNSPLWLLARSHAHLELKNYEDALRDAELAYHVAAERGSGRKQMIDAQYRRATIYHRLKQYADSDCCAKWSMLLAEGRPAREDDGVEKNVDAEGYYTVTYEDAVADNANQPDYSMRESLKDPGVKDPNAKTIKTGFESQWKRAYTWRTVVLGILKRLPKNDPGRKVHVSKIPPKPELKKVEKKAEPLVVELDSEDEKPVAKPSEPAPGSVPDEKLKLRTDFYQSNQNVTVSLFVKGTKKEELNVKFSKNQVCQSELGHMLIGY